MASAESKGAKLADSTPPSIPATRTADGRRPSAKAILTAVQAAATAIGWPVTSPAGR
jgi:hypothetical protein